MRPLIFLGLARKRPHAWTPRDRVLAQAIELYDRSLTPEGLPSWVANDPDRLLTLDEHTNYAAALLEQEREKQGNTTPAPGLRMTVVDLGLRDD